jgi:hypothetical protein
MEISVSMGQWNKSLSEQMSKASDGDLFLLPTFMHLHAFQLVKEEYFPQKQFRVKVQP